MDGGLNPNPQYLIHTLTFALLSLRLLYDSLVVLDAGNLIFPINEDHGRIEFLSLIRRAFQEDSEVRRNVERSVSAAITDLDLETRKRNELRRTNVFKVLPQLAA